MSKIEIVKALLSITIVLYLSVVNIERWKNFAEKINKRK